MTTYTDVFLLTKHKYNKRFGLHLTYTSVKISRPVMQREMGAHCIRHQEKIHKGRLFTRLLEAFFE